MAFAAVFEYEVDPANAHAFEAAYGADGDWARFFRTGEGYLGTDLWRAAGGTSYLLIDRWRSAADYVAFLAGRGEEYRRRSDSAESLYRSERALGRFEAAR
jgi:heme-degrading monooxygenase HmoA